jgi:hypothetical protein
MINNKNIIGTDINQLKNSDEEILIPVWLKDDVNSLEDVKFILLEDNINNFERKERLNNISKIECSRYYWDKYEIINNENKAKIVCIDGHFVTRSPNNGKLNIELRYLEGIIPKDKLLLYKKGEEVQINADINPICNNEELFNQDKEPIKFYINFLKQTIIMNKWELMEDIPIEFDKNDYVKVQSINVNKLNNNNNNIKIELIIPINSIIDIEYTGIWGNIELSKYFNNLLLSKIILGPIGPIIKSDNSINNKILISNSIDMINDLDLIGSKFSILIKPFTKIVRKFPKLSKSIKKLSKSTKKSGKSATKKVSKIFKKKGVKKALTETGTGLGEAVVTGAVEGVTLTAIETVSNKNNEDEYYEDEYEEEVEEQEEEEEEDKDEEEQEDKDEEEEEEVEEE